MDAQYWIDRLQLARHPEGGYYRETYRASLQVPTAAGLRAVSTTIYFLLPAGEISALHRIRSDEGWHFYAGQPLKIHLLDPAGSYRGIELGPSCFQATVPAGHWFGATVEVGFALVGCTVAPGFDFADFEIADRGGLLRSFPQHREIIERLTSPPAVTT